MVREKHDTAISQDNRRQNLTMMIETWPAFPAGSKFDVPEFSSFPSPQYRYIADWDKNAQYRF
jgi:hypothetical protein